MFGSCLTHVLIIFFLHTCILFRKANHKEGIHVAVKLAVYEERYKKMYCVFPCFVRVFDVCVCMCVCSHV